MRPALSSLISTEARQRVAVRGRRHILTLDTLQKLRRWWRRRLRIAQPRHARCWIHGVTYERGEWQAFVVRNSAELHDEDKGHRLSGIERSEAEIAKCEQERVRRYAYLAFCGQNNEDLQLTLKTWRSATDLMVTIQ